MKTPDELGLTRAEWSVILDAMNGHYVLREFGGQPMLAAKDEIWPNVEDHIQLNRADLTHKAHADLMLTKLAAFEDADWEVVMSVVEGFWELSPDVQASRIPGKED